MSNEIERRQQDARTFLTEDQSDSQELVPADAPIVQAERRLASEDVVIAAPMSFHGSAARIWKLTRMSPGNDLATIGLSVLAVLLIGFAWTFVLAWYVVFGLLLVPYRLVRRGQRKRKLDEARHRELVGRPS
jgi:hypothetical protein